MRVLSRPSGYPDGMTPVAMGEYPDPPELTGIEDAPSGLPPEEPEEAAPLGVPADEQGEPEPPGPGAMPGIPTDGEPPAAS